jgi:hypothetical protein
MITMNVIIDIFGVFDSKVSFFEKMIEG